VSHECYLNEMFSGRGNPGAERLCSLAERRAWSGRSAATISSRTNADVADPNAGQ